MISEEEKEERRRRKKKKKKKREEERRRTCECVCRRCEQRETRTKKRPDDGTHLKNVDEFINLFKHPIAFSITVEQFFTVNYPEKIK